MPMDGRLEGRKSEDGTAYELWQRGAVVRSIPIHEAMADEKLMSAIRRNQWEPL